MMQRSPLQQAIADWALSTPSKEVSKNAIVVARAGCGKTTTIMQVVTDLIKQNPRQSIFIGAYNKAIAVEIQDKLKKANIDWKQGKAGTMHSIGFSIWKANAKDVKVDEKKVANILADFAFNDVIYANCGGTIKQAVSMAKQLGFGFLKNIDDHGAWVEMLEHYGINDIPEEFGQNEVIVAAMKVLRRSQEQDYEVIDFDDMLAAPLVHKARVQWPYDWVFIDEAQDTNATRRELAKLLVRPRTGRFVAVGDDRQAIYGFTGADATALNIIATEMNAVRLPLNVTYRCPKAIVAQAQRYVPDISAHETAPDGVVNFSNLEAAMLNPHETFGAMDVILCRNTGPIVELAYKFIRLRIPAKVEGRDIGKGLQALANRWKVKSLSQLSDRLDKYLDREVAKWMAKGKEDRAEQVTDKVETIRVLISLLATEKKTMISDLDALIESMFADTLPGQPQTMLTLSTIHKSKGREWKRVFLLGANKYMPSPYAKQDWQLLQEDNLAYVAVTRAMQELTYLDV